MATHSSKRSLAGYSPWGHQESDRTQRLNHPVHMLLLLSHFSRVRLCATPQTAAHQASPSLEFSRQEHWSGLPFPSPMHKSESEVAQLCPTLRPHGLPPTRFLLAWDFPGKSTGVGCHCLLQHIYIHVYICMCVCVYIYMKQNTSSNICICMCINLYIHTYTHTYLCLDTYIQTHIHFLTSYFFRAYKLYKS